MYRNTKNNLEDIRSICDIYNTITGRNRTPDLHKWEWFESPYENKSYVIVDKNDNILGHHGILTIKLNHNENQYIAGKTENTIMKKEYGALYFKNEQEMHTEYNPKYDILITTAAHGVIKKIREKLGYKVFSKYITYIQIVSIKILLKKFKNRYFAKLITIVAPFIDMFIFNKKTNLKYNDINRQLTEQDLLEIEQFYSKNEYNFGISQIRSIDFLKYRLLNNPYIKYNILKLYNGYHLLGYLIYYENKNIIVIEDLLFLDEKIKIEMLSRLFNYTKKIKNYYGIVFRTLENTFLDKRTKGFFNLVIKDKDDFFMIKSKSDNIIKEDFYFTKLMNEGIR